MDRELRGTPNGKLTLDDIKHNLKIYQDVYVKYPIIETPMNDIICKADLHWISHKLCKFGAVDVDKINKSDLNKEEFIDFIKSELAPSVSYRFSKEMDCRKLFHELDSISISPSIVNEVISFYINNPGEYNEICLSFRKVDISSGEIIAKLDKTYQMIDEMNDLKGKLKSFINEYDVDIHHIMAMVMDMEYEEQRNIERKQRREEYRKIKNELGTNHGN